MHDYGLQIEASKTYNRSISVLEERLVVNVHDGW